MSENKIYRANVAVVVVNDQGQILACRRSDLEHIWQIPQGGIEEGETAKEAMARELLEEIGTADLEIIGRLPKTIRYEWPEELFSRGYHGQEQTYFLVRLNDQTTINLQANPDFAEFIGYRWMLPADFLATLTGFKQKPYTEAISRLTELFPDAFGQKRG